jgi:hypothetical protein
MILRPALAIARQVIYGPDSSKEQILEKFFSRNHADDPSERLYRLKRRQNLAPPPKKNGLYPKILSNSGASL